MVRRLATWVLAGLATGCGAEDDRGRLVVVERHPPGAIYQEGSIGFLRITHAASDEVVFDSRVTEPHGRRGGVLFNRRLPPGRYRVVSFQRACIANCHAGALDDPSDRCETVVSVRPGETARRAMRLGRRGGCRFTTPA